MSDLSPGRPGSVSKLNARVIIILAITAGCLIFVLSNNEDVSLRFLWLEITAPGWVFLFLQVALGFLLGLAVGRSRYRK